MNNIILLGHGVGVKKIIEILHDKKNNLGFRIAGVVTHPKEKHTRDLKIYKKRANLFDGYEYDVFDVKKDFDIDVFESKNANNEKTIEWIDQFHPKYLISIGCRDILKQSFIEHYNSNVLNIHTAPLPAYRGAATDTWMILNGEWGKETFGCVHYIDTGIDSGKIIAKSCYEIPKLAYPIDIFKKRMLIYPDLITKALTKLKKENFSVESQDIEEATVFPRLKTLQDGKIDFKNFNGEEILRFIYAFGYPYEGAFCYQGDLQINILKAKFYRKGGLHPFGNGLIYGKNKDQEYKVIVKGGFLSIKTIEVNGAEVEQNKIFRLGKFLR